MDDIIYRINRLRAVPHHPPFNLLVKRVAVILTGSRSGSSLLKQVLQRHPDIASLSGEMEPLLALTENIFPYASDSDALTRVKNRDQLLDNVFDELGLPSSEPCDRSLIKERWRKRFLLQFPDLFRQEIYYQQLLAALERALFQDSLSQHQQEDAIHRTVLEEVFSSEPWRINFYDGFGDPALRRSFNEPVKIEEPPFVTPDLTKRSLTKEDLATKVLLFKTPQDCYRIGLYEQLFPNADITYIHLTRGFAQTVNGLIDGWLSPTGFFAHDMRKVSVTLAIAGYSDICEFGARWWKFDLPPNWRNFTQSRLVDVCLNQWLSAHMAVLASQPDRLQIQFEDFLANPSETANRIFSHLSLRPINVPNQLPVVMATTRPAVRRWRKRADLLLPLQKIPEVRQLMTALKYSMDPTSWV